MPGERKQNAIVAGALVGGAVKEKDDLETGFGRFLHKCRREDGGKMVVDLFGAIVVDYPVLQTSIESTFSKEALWVRVDGDEQFR